MARTITPNDHIKFVKWQPIGAEPVSEEIFAAYQYSQKNEVTVVLEIDGVMCVFAQGHSLTTVSGAVS